MELFKSIVGTVIVLLVAYAGVLMLNRNIPPTVSAPLRSMDAQSMDDVEFSGKIYQMCIDKGGVPTLDSVRWLANGCVFPPAR